MPSTTEFDTQFESIAQAVPIPDPVQKDAESIIASAADADILSDKSRVVDVAAAVLLARRQPLVTMHREAKNIAAVLPNVSFKHILAATYRFIDADLNTLPSDRGVSALTEALSLAADELQLSTTDIDGLDSWINEHGLGNNGHSTQIVARQTVLTVFLRNALTEHASNTTLTQKTYQDTVQQTHNEIGNSSPTQFILDNVALLLPPNIFEWVTSLTTHLTVVDNPSEFIGACYERLIDQEDRWRLGQFRTPPTLATLVASLGIHDPNNLVLAPGIGAGALATGAAHRKQQLGSTNQLSDIIGVDISPVSLLMGSVALTYSNFNGNPSFHSTDFFDLNRDDITDVDAIITNPPYTKHHELPIDLKRSLNKQMERTVGHSLSMLSPLYAYFTMQASTLLDDGGTAVFLTPAEILATEYGTDWKRFLLDTFDITGFILFDQDNGTKFENVDTTSLITIATKRDSPSEAQNVRFVRVENTPTIDDAKDLLTTPGQGPERLDTGFVNTLPQADLDPNADWDILFDELEPVIDDELVPLHSLCRVTRGIATGQNSFFCLTEDEQTGEHGNLSWDINEKFLSPAIRGAHTIPHYDYRETDWSEQRSAGSEVWLLYLQNLTWDSSHYEEDLNGAKTTQQHLDSFDPSYPDVSIGERNLTDEEVGVVEYLKYGMQSENPPNKTHLAENRSRWYRVEEQRNPPDILYTSMTRGRGRFVLNKMGARNLNNVHSIDITVDLSITEKKALLAYLNSDFSDQIVKRNGRTLSSGMHKVEPGDLRNIPVIDPRTIDDEIVSTLAELFESLCRASRSGDEDAVRDELQAVLQSFLTME
jgi:methylase of polypeptide subunit release factors